MQKVADDYTAIAKRLAELEQERQQRKDEQPISLEQWVPVPIVTTETNS